MGAQRPDVRPCTLAFAAMVAVFKISAGRAASRDTRAAPRSYVTPLTSGIVIQT